MQPTLCLKTIVDYQIVKCVTSQQKIVLLIEKNINTLKSILEETNKYINISGYIPSTPIIYRSTRELYLIDKVSTFSVIVLYPPHLLPFNSIIEEDQRLVKNVAEHDLPRFISNQTTILEKVKHNQVDNLIFIADIDLSSTRITTAKTFMGVECPDCGDVQSMSSIKRHMTSLKCLQAASERGLVQAGWKQIDDHAIVYAIQTSGVPYDIRAVQYRMWIPPWVDMAIKQYKANEGYGGLKLSEFLAKMKPE